MFKITFIFAAATCWALDSLFRYPLLGQGISPIYIVWLEHLLLVFLLFPVVGKDFFYKFKGFRKDEILAYFIIGFLGSGVATLAFTQAFSLVNPTLVILLQKLQPFIAHIFAIWVLNEKTPKYFWFYLLVALMGSILLTLPEFSTQLFQNISILNEKIQFGLFLTMISIFFWGMSTVFGKHLTNKNHSTGQTMYGRFVFGFIYLSIHLLIVWKQIQFQLSFTQIRAVFLLVVLSGLFGMWLYYQGMKHLSARQVALGELFFPVAAVIVNWVAFSITINSQQIIGALMLVSASFLFMSKKANQ